MLELVHRAEALGFHSVGFNDNQCGSRELMLTLGAAATSTSRIRIGSAVANPVTGHISVLASAFYSLRELAGERGFLGLGRGELSVSLIGARQAPVDRLAQTIEKLRALWAGDTVDVDGSPTRLLYAAGTPLSIPIYVAATHVAMTAVRPSASTFDAADRDAAELIRASYSAAGHLELETDYTRHVTDRLLRKLALAGTAAEVRQRIHDLAAIGLDQIDVIPCGREPAKALEAIATAAL